ncbi:MAG: hypothetical protein ABI556_16460 [Gemmatimonadales bacterium]
MRRIGQLIPALVLIACGPEAGPIVPERGPVNIFTGTFTLVTLDGVALPSTFPPAGAPVEITSGSITLKPDLTFVLIDRLRNVPGPGVSAEESGGTYQFSDTDIALIFQNRVITGGINGDNLTVHRGAASFVYRR